MALLVPSLLVVAGLAVLVVAAVAALVLARSPRVGRIAGAVLVAVHLASVRALLDVS